METPTLRTVTDELVEQVKDRIVEACEPEAVFLFGSAARGGTRKDSDIDLLVVIKPIEGMSRYEQASELYKLFRGWLLPLDIVVRSPEEFAREKELLGLISNIVVTEGIRIYAKSA